MKNKISQVHNKSHGMVYSHEDLCSERGVDVKLYTYKWRKLDKCADSKQYDGIVISWSLTVCLVVVMVVVAVAVVVRCISNF